MANYKGSNDPAKGSPNLEALQNLQEDWDNDKIVASNLLATIAVRKVKTSIISDASSTAVTVDIPEGAEIIDIVVHSNATSGSGTVTVQIGSGGAGISDAIVMSTDTAVTRIGTIDNKTVTSAGVELITNGAADRGDVYIFFNI